MSEASSGTMLADFVVARIDNITEMIWMQGGNIPAGKRVIVGFSRHPGWCEVTFQMGARNELTGRATVPVSYVRLDTVGRGLGAYAMLPGMLRARGVGAFIPAGAPVMGPVNPVSMPGARVRPPVAYQRAPAPHYDEGGKRPPHGGDPYLRTRIRADWEENGVVYPPPPPEPYPDPPPAPPSDPKKVIKYGQWGSQRGFIPQHGPGPVQNEPPPTPPRDPGPPPEPPPRPPEPLPVRAYESFRAAPGLRSGIYPYYRRVSMLRGLGAAGASEFTVKAAEELDEHLTTNGCAGCDDYKSSLRQLTFKFKAACMTDPTIQNQVSFNMDTPLAMTAFGTGTNKALSLVLGSQRTYEGGPCTDDAGNCLGRFQIPSVVPVALIPLAEQVATQIKNAIAGLQSLPTPGQLAKQKDTVEMLAGIVGSLLVALSAALPKPGPGPQEQPPKMIEPTPPAGKEEPKKTPWGTILVGTALAGAGVAAIYYVARRA